MNLDSKNSIILYSLDPVMRGHLRTFIDHLSESILTPASGSEFGACLDAETSATSLVIYDVNNAETRTRSHIEDMRKTLPGVPVVFLVESYQDGLAKELARTSSWKVLVKPFLPQDLKVSILSAVGEVKGVELSPREVVEAGGHQGSAKQYHPQLLLGESRAMEGVKTVIDHVANTDVTILIRGESGTGKELTARTLYECSSRAEKPFVTVLCPAIPEPLLESELFGYEKGSFTGAFRRRPGKFEIANKGTIFLDEIGDIPFELQSKLLHVLQGGEFARIGGADQKVDVRILAATNKDLEKAVSDGTFREDLYYRLNVVSIFLPPLRERKEDIRPLVDRFLKKFNSQFNKQYPGLNSRTLEAFMNYHWPGNVRELENLVKRIVIMGDEKTILQQYVDRAKGNPSPSKSEKDVARVDDDLELEGALVSDNGSGFPSLKQVGKKAMLKAEGEAIEKALEVTRWNRKAAARLLKISYKALLYKIKQCGIEGASPNPGGPGSLSSIK